VTPASSLAPPITGFPPAPLFSVASLFVQYKRPFHLETQSSADGVARASAFGTAAAPFFRVKLSNEQHGTLSHWEASVGRLGGIVRYAAPRFWRWSAMAQHQVQGNVHVNSAWLSPKALGASLIWTYDDPAGLHHMRHSHPEAVEGEGLGDVANRLQRVAREGGVDVIREHLGGLADVARKLIKMPDQLLALDVGFRTTDDDALAVVADVATVRYAAASQGISWALLVRLRGTTTPSLREALARVRGIARP
jgi:hypothetical protein